jgi:hypothetical protein
LLVEQRRTSEPTGPQDINCPTALTEISPSAEGPLNDDNPPPSAHEYETLNAPLKP